jgi:hypothetical protein
MADDLNRTVHTRTPKTSDIEVRVSTLTTENGPFVEIREYVKSLDQYGRGITFPAENQMLMSVIDGLTHAVQPLAESTS